jgi:hypothetical protein
LDVVEWTKVEQDDQDKRVWAEDWDDDDVGKCELNSRELGLVFFESFFSFFLFVDDEFAKQLRSELTKVS